MDLVQTCERLCLASYDDDAPGFVSVKDLRYGVFKTPHGTILCIRGTKDLHNWLRNVRVAPWPSCTGHIAHKGFITTFQDLCAGGMPTGKDQIDYATGHSLGGAAATLAAARIGCKLVTFGSPKVYFRFSPAPQLDHIRVVKDDDPVPWVPGVFYSHRCDALQRKDGDHHLVDIGDHYMKGYITHSPIGAAP